MAKYYVYGNGEPVPNLGGGPYAGYTPIEVSAFNFGQSSTGGQPDSGDLLPGDEVVISGSVDSDVTPHPATIQEQINSGSTNPVSPVPVTITVLANSNDFDIDFDDSNSQELQPTVNVVGEAGRVNIRGAETDNMNLTVESGASIGNVSGGTEATDNDVITTRANSTIGNIDTNNGDDQVTIGGRAGSIATEGGNDKVTVNQGGETGTVSSGSGADEVTVNQGGETGNIGTGGGADQVQINEGGTSGRIGTGGGNDQVTVQGRTLNVVTGSGGDVVTVSQTGQTNMIETGGGEDQVTVAGTAGNIRTGANVDVVNVQQSGEVGDIGTAGGNDQVMVNGTSGEINVGSGADSIDLGDGANTGSLLLGTGASNGDTVSAGDNVKVDGIINQEVANSKSDVQFGDGAEVTAGIDLNGGDDTLIFGDNSTIRGPIRTGDDNSTSDRDVLEIGANSRVDGFINTNTGRDYVEIGDNTTLNGGGDGGTALNTEIGADTVVLGAGVSAPNGDIFTGADSDQVFTSSGNATVDQGTITPNNDLITIDYGGGGKAAFEAALQADGYTLNSGSPYGAGIYYGGRNSDGFTYNGITYNDIDWVRAVCFTTGTMITTAEGETLIDDLKVGDMVMTRDNGLQPIRWIGQRALSGDLLVDKLKPIRIAAGALGAGIPSSDLLVSPQHRVLVRSKIAQRMFSTDEVLVAAKQLLLIDGVDIADVDEITYVHILFDRHEVVTSNGAETESLYTGPEALKSVGPAAREEIFAIFPELAERDHEPVPARVLASGRLGRKLATRHAQNRQVLVS